MKLAFAFSKLIGGQRREVSDILKDEKNHPRVGELIKLGMAQMGNPLGST